MNTLLIAGTDTGVGKTWVGRALGRALADAAAGWSRSSRSRPGAGGDGASRTACCWQPRPGSGAAAALYRFPSRSPRSSPPKPRGSHRPRRTDAPDRSAGRGRGTRPGRGGSAACCRRWPGSGRWWTSRARWGRGRARGGPDRLGVDQSRPPRAGRAGARGAAGHGLASRCRAPRTRRRAPTPRRSHESAAWTGARPAAAGRPVHGCARARSDARLAASARGLTARRPAAPTARRVPGRAPPPSPLARVRSSG